MSQLVSVLVLVVLLVVGTLADSRRSLQPDFGGIFKMPHQTTGTLERSPTPGSTAETVERSKQTLTVSLSGSCSNSRPYQEILNRAFGSWNFRSGVRPISTSSTHNAYPGSGRLGLGLMPFQLLNHGVLSPNLKPYAVEGEAQWLMRSSTPVNSIKSRFPWNIQT